MPKAQQTYVQIEGVSNSDMVFFVQEKLSSMTNLSPFSKVFLATDNTLSKCIQSLSMWWQTLALCSCQTWHLWDVELTSRALCGPSSFCWGAVFVRVCTFDCAFCVERCASVLLCILHSSCRRLCFCTRCVRRLAESQPLPIQGQGQVFFLSDSGDNTLLYISFKSEFFYAPFRSNPETKWTRWRNEDIAFVKMIGGRRRGGRSYWNTARALSAY